jgi:PAS domain S-box-containing protein
LRRLTIWLGAALLAVEIAVTASVVAATAQEDSGWVAFVVIPAVAAAFVVSGLIALERRPENRTGLYLGAVGYLALFSLMTLSANEWVFAIGFAGETLIWAPFSALVLAYPTGYIQGRVARLIPVVTGVVLTTASVLLLLVDSTPATARCDTCPESPIAVADLSGLAAAIETVTMIFGLGLIALVLTLLVRRWRAASPTLRRLLWPVLAAGSATLFAIGLAVVADEVSEPVGEVLGLLVVVCLASVPVAFLMGILRSRLARGSVTELVVGLQEGTPLTEALAHALRDPSLEVFYRLDPTHGLGGAGWVDPQGRAVPEPKASRARAVRFVDQRGERVAALVCDASLLHEPELVDAVTAAAGLAISNERLQAELRAEIALTKALAETAPALLTNVDTEGRIVKLNRATVRASGHRREADVLGRFFWEVFIDPEERDEMMARFAAAAPDFPPSEYENTFTNARGERLVVYWRSAPVRDEDGRVVSIVAGGLDITERKQREEEALAGEERLRAVIDNAPAAIVEVDLDRRVRQWNPAAERMFGWSAAEILGKPLPIVPPDRQDEFSELMRPTGPARTGIETVRLRRDGSLVEVDLASAPIRDVSGAVVGRMAVFTDITERKRREEEARLRSGFLDAIRDAIPSYLVAVDPEGVVMEDGVNPAFTQVFGWTKDEIAGRSFLEVISDQDQYEGHMAIANAANGVIQAERESWWVGRDGSARAVGWTARPVLDPQGRDIVLVTGSDVTVRRLQEEELRASRARLVEAADDARRKLERNLHDGAQQRLVALSVSLRLAESKLQTDPTSAVRILAGAREELMHALEDLRELARGIHPAVLTDRGLAAAVEALVSRSPVPVETDVPEVELPPAVEAAAYYVVAEALTNVVKYGQASAAEVAVEATNGIVRVIVRDDGVGGADPAQGSGLRGLVDRIEALEGKLVVDSPLGKGTTVRAEIPITGHAR